MAWWWWFLVGVWMYTTDFMPIWPLAFKICWVHIKKTNTDGWKWSDNFLGGIKYHKREYIFIVPKSYPGLILTKKRLCIAALFYYSVCISAQTHIFGKIHRTSRSAGLSHAVDTSTCFSLAAVWSSEEAYKEDCKQPSHFMDSLKGKAANIFTQNW